MTDKLPPNLLALFAPRPALRYLPHCDHAAEDRKTANITGVAQFLDKLREPDDFQPTESWLERRDRVKLEKKAKQEKHLTTGFSKRQSTLLVYLGLDTRLIQCHKYADTELDTADAPENDPQVRGDAFKTLFVARLSYDTKETDLEREFGRFGPIERASYSFRSI